MWVNLIVNLLNGVSLLGALNVLCFCLLHRVLSDLLPSLLSYLSHTVVGVDMRDEL